MRLPRCQVATGKEFGNQTQPHHPREETAPKVALESPKWEYRQVWINLTKQCHLAAIWGKRKVGEKKLEFHQTKPFHNTWFPTSCFLFHNSKLSSQLQAGKAPSWSQHFTSEDSPNLKTEQLTRQASPWTPRCSAWLQDGTVENPPAFSVTYVLASHDPGANPESSPENPWAPKVTPKWFTIAESHPAYGPESEFTSLKR